MFLHIFYRGISNEARSYKYIVIGTILLRFKMLCSCVICQLSWITYIYAPIAIVGHNNLFGISYVQYRPNTSTNLWKIFAFALCLLCIGYQGYAINIAQCLGQPILEVVLIPIVIYLFLTTLCLVSVPFDEDDKDKTVWFLDHDYLESMYSMFKKVNG